MVTTLPPAQAAANLNNLNDLPPTSPPRPTMFHPNIISQPIPSTQIVLDSRSQHRLPDDYRSNGLPAFSNGDGALPVPAGPPPQHAQVTNGGLRHRVAPGGGVFDGPRSPPSTKNTSHVPCKFFRSGQCQAGKACPFSHSTDISTADTPCKYFAKGNCKFGAKCALAHVLPNGRRVNRPNGTAGGHLNLGGRVDPQSYHHQDSALANSILIQQANGNLSAFSHQYSQFSDGDFGPQNGLGPKPYENVPFIDTSYASHPGSKYGSPRDDSRMPLSPVVHLSALDAPMPASFDSQGISYMARHGPVAASVPSKFGLESPPASLPKKAALPSDALRNLHDSAFGREFRAKGPNLGSSPLGSGDELSGQRIMHSQRLPKPRMLSASLPRARAHAADDWDDGLLFGQEEDFLPTSLHDLLTPQEKTRRLSKTEQDPGILRDSSSGLGTPAESSSKVGSPGTASPSRFGALFARQKREEENSQATTGSVFGHVGSPLRNSSLHPSASPRLRASSSNTISGDLSPRFASPSRQSSMSMISQQLSRTRLASRASESTTIGSDATSSTLQFSLARYPSSSSSNNLNRAISSSSMGTGRINEEQADGVFPMEEEEDAQAKLYGGSGWNISSGSGGESQSLGPSTDEKRARQTGSVSVSVSAGLGAGIGAGVSADIGTGTAGIKARKEFWT